MNASVQPLPSLSSPPSATAGRDGALHDIGALARETLGDRVTRELRALLIAGRLAPGEKLSLRSVAQALGVSMMPVREAVGRLAAESAFEVLPGRAVRVPILTREQFRELTHVRLAIEGFAAEEAARRATPAQIADVAAHEAAFRQAANAEPADPAAAMAANRALHFALYEAAGLPSLVEIIERLWLKAGPAINFQLRLEPDRLKGGSALLAHARLLDALRRGDAARCRAALEDDIRAAAAHIEKAQFASPA